MRTQDSRTDIPTRAGGGGARERRGILDPQSGRRQAIGPPAEPCVASAIRAGSEKRSGAVLTASSSWTDTITEFTMKGGRSQRRKKRLSQCGMRYSCCSARARW